MFNRKEISLKQYVELAKAIKESYEYLNVEKVSTHYARVTSPPTSALGVSQTPEITKLHKVRST